MIKLNELKNQLNELLYEDEVNDFEIKSMNDFEACVRVALLLHDAPDNPNKERFMKLVHDKLINSNFRINNSNDLNNILNLASDMSNMSTEVK